MTLYAQLNVLKSIMFWDMTPGSPLSVNRRFGGTYHLHFQGRRNKFSKKPARKQVARTTRRHIPEHDTLHNHRCEKPQILQIERIVFVLNMFERNRRHIRIAFTEVCLMIFM
jgi:hypothetical protein